MVARRAFGRWYDITPKGEQYSDKLMSEYWGSYPDPRRLTPSQRLSLASKQPSYELLILSDVELAGYPRLYPTHLHELAGSQSKAGIALRGRYSRVELEKAYSNLVMKGYLEELKSKPIERVLNQYGSSFVEEEREKGTLSLEKED